MMNVVVLVVLLIIIVTLAVLMHSAQASLERWEQRRHADD
jgi:type II secretory pathway pseudopilin PulG